MFDAEAFRAKLDWLGTSETEALLAALDGEPSVSVRLNPQKSVSPFTSQSATFSAIVPWCGEGRYLDRRPSFTMDPGFHAGGYYVQEASSMFVEWLLRGSVHDFKGLRVLDLCASPGGKTTLYSSVLGAEGVVVANEPIRPRVATLINNVRRWGVGNVIVTDCDPARFGVLEDFFDVVAVDAPCSGEGMFRKDKSTREQWTEDLVTMCSARQRRILANAWQALRPGGTLIYSTCTFNRTENEDNIAWLAEEFGAEGVVAEPFFEGIYISEAAGIRCYRFFPHRVRGEGFFACAVRKPETSGQQRRPSKQHRANIPFLSSKHPHFSILSSYLQKPASFVQFADSYYAEPEAIAEVLPALTEALHVVYSGVSLGQIFKNTLKPDHPLAMFCELDRSAVNIAELTENEALNYLHLSTVDATPFADGINLVTYRGAALGWINRVGGRVNNLYPKSMAIKKG